ncbi:MAG: hypothetical protein LBG77_06125 [Dysgonamonadaceae bacterium]|jgi:hypothetical protein|nr:hypothetical protein [Dysgonamonadaceae bacterium]
MDDDFRKKMRELDEIGFIGNPRHKYNEKDRFIFSGAFQASRAFRKEHLRDMTPEETLQLGKDLERAYNREVRQKRKAAVKQIAAVL